MGGQIPDRCRLVLTSPAGEDWQRSADQIANAVAGGDVASVIFWPAQLGERDFQRLCEVAVPQVQAAGAAAVIAGDRRIAARCAADGVHFDKKEDISEALRGGQDGMIVGAGGAKNRHEALELGELRPDYVFFGRFGFDNKPQPHPRNLALGQWWAELVEIPCIVMAGSVIGSIEEIAATGAEFVAVSAAVFTGTLEPGEAIRRANALLDEKAPHLQEVN
ncbi:MAG: thiamine phosphate synthase [Rhizobiaceae bacterium]